MAVRTRVHRKPGGRTPSTRRRPFSRRLPLLLLVTGLVAGCSSSASEPTSAPASTTTTTTTTSSPSSPAAAFQWQRVTPGDETLPSGMEEVVVGGPGLVAVGGDGSGGDFDAAVWVSSDGNAWDRVAHDDLVFGGPGDQIVRDLTAGGPGLVAIGFDTSGDDWDAVVWTSADGLAWTRVPDTNDVFGGPGMQVAHGMVASERGIVAVGVETDEEGDQDVAVWTSPDGLTWMRVPHDEDVFGGEGNQAAHAVTHGDFGFVAAGYDAELAGGGADFDAAMWVSPDGERWSRVPHDEATFGGPDWQGTDTVIAGGPGLVALGWSEDDGPYDVVVWSSVDGAEWARAAPDAQELGGEGEQIVRALIEADLGLVAVGRDAADGDDDAAIWISTDGVTWIQLHDESFGGPDAQEIRGVTVFGDLIVAVGVDRSTGPPTAAIWVGRPAA